MNNILVYCELDGNKVAEVSMELLSKGRQLADTLGVELHAVYKVSIEKKRTYKGKAHTNQQKNKRCFYITPQGPVA